MFNFTFEIKYQNRISNILFEKNCAQQIKKNSILKNPYFIDQIGLFIESL